MIIDIYNPYTNQDVTVDYVSIIVSALKLLGHQPVYCDKISKNKKEKGIIVIAELDAIKARLKGYKKIILWQQGVWGEESYMRNNSKIRFFITSWLEKKAIKLSDMVFMVSDEMRLHYLKKYKFEPRNYFIMPCFNEEFDKNQFMKHNYSKNVFIYAGGLSKWQCFEKTMDLYKNIENKYGEKVELRILTKDIETAKNIIENKGICNYSIDFVPKEKVREEMKYAKFGFCIREDNPVNNVATPTKLSSYVCNGVIPIYSAAIRDFSKVAKSSNYVLNIDSPDYIDRLDNLITNEIKTEALYDDYSKTFGNYYSKTKYINQILLILKKVLDE